MAESTPREVARQLVTAFLILNAEGPSMDEALHSEDAARAWLEAEASYKTVLDEALYRMDRDVDFASDLIGQLVGFVATLIRMRAVSAHHGDSYLLDDGMWRLTADVALKWWRTAQEIQEERGRWGSP